VEASVNDWNRLVETWTATLTAVNRLGGHTTLESAKRAGIRHSKIWGLDIGPPAQAADLERVEAQLGIGLPAALAHTFLQCASSVDFLWQLPKDFQSPEPFSVIFSGGFSLSLGALHDHELSRRKWVQTCFPDPDSPDDAVWHNKLAVIKVRNGDYIGIDLGEGHQGEVVYLSHEDGEGEGHGYVLGADFADFLRRWTPLGCPGPEDWQWLPFTSDRTSMLKSDGEVADRWRTTLGLEMP
jgi:cell wall assembly regulator SMI1